MESIGLALGLATIIVVVLLKSCASANGQSCATPNVSGARGKRSGMGSGEPLDPMSDPTQDPDCPDGYKSTWGTGVLNRQMDAQYSMLKGLKGYGDYNEVAQLTSLEPEVYASHASFTNDLGITNKGASTLTVRSDPNDVNPWIGLRRPDYHSVYTMCDARVDSSESPDQMFAQTRYLI